MTVTGLTFKEGLAIATRKEVADLAGVSEATVSRVLNGVGPMKEETRRRVLEAVERLGYHPNAIAQSFARGRSGNIGVVLPYVPKVHLFSTYYFSETLSGIGATAAEKGYDLLLKFRSPDKESDYTNLFQRQKVDACIILGARNTPAEKESLLRLKEGGIPFCLVNQHFEDAGFNEVDADHIEGSYSATRHLLGKGYRRIAFLNGSPEYSNSRDRLEGYRKALEEAGIASVSSLLFEGNYSRTSGYRAAAAIRDSGAEAVVAANDRMAIGLMQGLRELGVSVGRHVALVGYDDSDAARIADPPLTSVAVPFFEMGKAAAGQLLSLLESQTNEPAFHVKLPTALVIRQSCSTTQ
ncbi:LacI family DNA-binding transcriptional regulator [Paenibacillus hamazuiensis]|uniref:LacI family DNA-binding transcriptional regulator n=1 Tax=Paenibacillus hamazuiensis TaxID=2936508 RepID=UPI003B8474D5